MVLHLKSGLGCRTLLLAVRFEREIQQGGSAALLRDPGCDLHGWRVTHVLYVISSCKKCGLLEHGARIFNIDVGFKHMRNF